MLKKIALSAEHPENFLQKSRSRAEHPENLHENRAPVRSILKISLRFVQNRAAVRSDLKILVKIALAEHPRNFIDSSFKIALPCGASSKFGGFFIAYV